MTSVPLSVTPPRRLPPWMPLLVVAAAWLAQGRVLGNGWVWDDAPVVRDGRDVRRGVAGIPALVASNWYGETDDVGLFRPLVGATLALDAALHGTDDAFGFHLTNLFLHGLVAVALLAVLHRLLPGRGVAVSATALLFAVHPLHTGTVSWIVARGDLLAALFSLLAALAWLAPGPVRPGRLLLAALCVFLALCGKEMAAPLPLALFVLDAARADEGPFRVLARRGWAYLVLLVPVVAWAVLRAEATGSFGTAPGMAALGGHDLGERVVVGLFGLARTAWNLAVPAGLSGDRSDDPLYEPGSSVPAAYVGVAAAVVLAVALALYRWARGRAGVPAAAWGLFFLLSLPVLQIVPLGTIHEDRFAYLPSLALLALGGAAVEALLATRARLVALAACAAAGLALVGASWRTAADWRDERAFDEALLARNPTHRPALNRLGRWHLEAGHERLVLEAARPAPADPKAPRPDLIEGQRHLGEAVRLLERAVSLPSRRQSAPIWRNLADARFELRDFARAIVGYKTAIEKKRVRLDGRSVPYQEVTSEDVVAGRVASADARFLADAWYRLGVSYEASGEAAEAVPPLRQAALWLPENGELQRRAGLALLGQGSLREALPFLERAAETLSGPDAASTRDTADEVVRRLREQADQWFARGLEAEKRADGQRQAIEAYENALALRPNYVRARLRVARLEARWKGNLRQAEEHLRQARADLDEEARDPSASAAALESLRAEADEIAREIAALRATGDDDE